MKLKKEKEHIENQKNLQKFRTPHSNVKSGPNFFPQQIFGILKNRHSSQHSNAESSVFFDNKKDRLPIGIYIISVIYLLGAIPTTILGVMLFLSPKMINQIPPFNKSPEAYAGVLNAFGILMLILALLFLIASIGLLKRKNWARIGIVSFNLINIIGGILSILDKDYLSLINIVFNCIVLIYLFFSKKVKKVFSQKESKNEKSQNSFLTQ